MADDLFIPPHRSVPRSELTYRFSRSSGPGGQFVNKVSSRVELEFNVNASSAFTEEEKRRIASALGRRIASDGTLRVLAQKSRSQWKNRAEAERKLLHLLAAALAPVKNRLPTKPTGAARARRMDSKRLLGKKKRLRKNPPTDGN